MKRMIALVLCVAILLCGCGAKNALGLPMVVKFEDMAYVRPDMDAVEDAALAAMAAGENRVYTVDDMWAGSQCIREAVEAFAAEYEK